MGDEAINWPSLTYAAPIFSKNFRRSLADRRRDASPLSDESADDEADEGEAPPSCCCCSISATACLKASVASLIKASDSPFWMASPSTEAPASRAWATLLAPDSGSSLSTTIVLNASCASLLAFSKFS